jgi:AmmeMemoRadiSam system protein B
MTTVDSDIRPSPLAGRWYPASSDDLTAMIDGFMADARPTPPPGRIVGLLVPHAGLIYSGPVAAYAFALIRDLKPDVVTILSPSHHPYLAALLTTAHDAYKTPLGVVPVDKEAVAALSRHMPLLPVRRDPEHSLEIELPFLQRVLPGGFRLLPVMLVDQSEETAEQLGHALAEVLANRHTLLVASSDLSHFYPQQVANELDKAVLDRVAAFDPQGVFAVEAAQKGFACGRGAIGAVMWAARDLGADTAEVVHYATSGDVTGDYRQVVGYGAGVFYERAQ